MSVSSLLLYRVLRAKPRRYGVTSIVFGIWHKEARSHILVMSRLLNVWKVATKHDGSRHRILILIDSGWKGCCGYISRKIPYRISTLTRVGDIKLLTIAFVSADLIVGAR